MKILFSESRPDYENYQFPYVIWAFPEADEPHHKLYELGFMPSKGTPPRFYLSRSIRVNLSEFTPSSENRRILRKHENITLEIIPREQFELTDAHIKMCLTCASERFGSHVMTAERLESIFQSPYTTHLYCFKKNDVLVGLVPALYEPPHVAHYNFAFYTLDTDLKSMGMYMMTSFLTDLASKHVYYAYLGTCYSRNTLYKTQFKGCEFYTGTRWSHDLDELKYLIDRHDAPVTINEHMLESKDYLERFLEGSLIQLMETSKISIPLSECSLT
jgi:hypothetical protein